MKKTEPKKITRKETRINAQNSVADSSPVRDKKDFNQFGLSDNVSIALNGNPRKLLSFKVRF